MIENKQLPYLLSLIDDDSPVTRRAVLKELSSYGKDLNRVLDTIEPKPTEATKRKIQELLAFHFVNDHGSQWLNWLNEKNDFERLEKAMVFISSFQNGFQDHGFIDQEVEDLAKGFTATGADINIFSLSEYLFAILGFAGEKEHYYDPKNSDLAYVLKHKKGLPISLVIIYMLVGKRLGLEIEGFNFPGHFMAISKWQGQNYLIDCFNAGQIFKEYDFLMANVGGNIENTRKLFKSNSKIIVGRVLRNLSKAFEVSGDQFRSRQAVDLLKELEN